jgi:hypothetical protein
MKFRAAFLVLLGLAASAAAQSAGPSEAELARKCDSQIPWISDGAELVDGNDRRADGARGRPRRAPRAGEDTRGGSEAAGPLVLPRVPGTHMTRAAVLDAYARIVFFTDPGSSISSTRSSFRSGRPATPR